MADRNQYRTDAVYPTATTITNINPIDQSAGRVALPFVSASHIQQPTSNNQLRSSNVLPYNGNNQLPDISSDPIFLDGDEDSKKCYSPFNLCLWISLPITIFLTIFQLIVAVLIDIFGAMFWSSSILILKLWTKRNQLWLKVLIVIFSPILILAGTIGMPCILNRLPNYRFLNQTASQWQRVKYYFPRQIIRCLQKINCPRWCKCRR